MKRDQEPERNTDSLSVDGVPVDPALVGSALDLSDPGNRQIEMRISAPALEHELQESGVQLTSSGVGSFIEQDVQEHGDVALQAYIDIAGSRPGVKPKKRPNPKWEWTRLSRVFLDGQTIVFEGSGRAVR
jgi:hypothetical protein